MNTLYSNVEGERIYTLDLYKFIAFLLKYTEFRNVDFEIQNILIVSSQ